MDFVADRWCARKAVDPCEKYRVVTGGCKGRLGPGVLIWIMEAGFVRSACQLPEIEVKNRLEESLIPSGNCDENRGGWHQRIASSSATQRATGNRDGGVNHETYHETYLVSGAGICHYTFIFACARPRAGMGGV